MVDKASHRWQQLLLQLEDPQPLFVVGQDCDACRDELPLFVTDELMGKSVTPFTQKRRSILTNAPFVWLNMNCWPRCWPNRLPNYE
ncbi:MAG: hypothetical protein AAF614_34590 [Chloroflexota bacterium]